MQAFQLISDQIIAVIAELDESAVAAGTAAAGTAAIGVRQDSRKWGVQPGPDDVGPRYASVLSSVASGCRDWINSVVDLRAAVEQTQQVLEETNGDQAAALRHIQDLLGATLIPTGTIGGPTGTAEPVAASTGLGEGTSGETGLGYQTGGR